MLAMRLADLMCNAGFGPFYGTPCGVLAPLYRVLEERGALSTVGREDNAVGIAAGAALCRKSPAVLMQNSGFGSCVNALASLAIPYRTPILLVISLRGTGCDDTPENVAMGKATMPIINELGLPVRMFDPDSPEESVRWARDSVIHQRRVSALLIEPESFGWRP